MWRATCIIHLLFLPICVPPPGPNLSPHNHPFTFISNIHKCEDLDLHMRENLQYLFPSLSYPTQDDDAQFYPLSWESHDFILPSDWLTFRMSVEHIWSIPFHTGHLG